MSKKLPQSEVEDMLNVLSAHFGERVAPVSEYCRAFEDWFSVADDYLEERYPLLHDQLPTLHLVIRKSAALVRFVYLGERPRSKMCPKHQGRWSGLAFETDCECAKSDGNITGWLPDEPKE